MYFVMFGEFTLVKDRHKITEKVEKSYIQYYGVKTGDQDIPWTPHVICKHAKSSLYIGKVTHLALSSLAYPWYARSQQIPQMTATFAQ